MRRVGANKRGKEMRPTTWLSFAIGALALVLVGAAPAAAQATRTWVSGVGDDANPCSRTAPCKTFAGAISKTAAGGVINTLDPGGYGAVTITKSISIVSDLSLGGILSASTSGITINAGVTDEVFLRGIAIDGGGSGGTFGVRFIAGRALTVQDCTIRNVTMSSTGVGIEVALSAGVSSTVIRNCTITGNSIGVRVKPTGTAVARVLIQDSLIERNLGGGIRAEGAGAQVRISNATISSNAPGLFTSAGGTIASFGNNVISLNAPDGAPTSTLLLK